MNYNNPDLDAGRHFDSESDYSDAAEKALFASEQEYIEIMEELEALLVAHGFERGVIDCIVDENLYLAKFLDNRALEGVQ